MQYWGHSFYGMCVTCLLGTDIKPLRKETQVGAVRTTELTPAGAQEQVCPRGHWALTCQSSARSQGQGGWGNRRAGARGGRGRERPASQSVLPLSRGHHVLVLLPRPEPYI